MLHTGAALGREALKKKRRGRGTKNRDVWESRDRRKSLRSARSRQGDEQAAGGAVARVVLRDLPQKQLFVFQNL